MVVAYERPRPDDKNSITTKDIEKSVSFTVLLYQTIY